MDLYTSCVDRSELNIRELTSPQGIYIASLCLLFLVIILTHPLPSPSYIIIS